MNQLARTCSHCLRGQHAGCTVPGTCGCETCNPPVVVWEDPPAARTGTNKRFLTADQEAQLRAHPKRWARIRTYDKPATATALAYSVKKGKSALDPAEWEATSRRLPEGGSALWLRYLGPAK